GIMFPTPAAPYTAIMKGKGFEIGRWKSRVSGRPEVGGMIPSSTMAEEILTPGDGQVRAMILVMTNPLRSAANSQQLEAAFSHLDFLVAVDFYINETTRHAHLILPTPSPVEHANYEWGPYHLSFRTVPNCWWSAFPPPPDAPDAWEVLLRLRAIFMGMLDRSLQNIDEVVFRQLAAVAVKSNCPWPGLAEEEIIEKLAGVIGPE